MADSFFKENPSVDERILMDQLEELLERFGVQIRYEAMRQDEDSVHVAGGLCLLRGEYVLIVNSNAEVRDKIRILGMALKQFDYDQIYIRPVLREFLERIPDQSRLTERVYTRSKRLTQTEVLKKNANLPARTEEGWSDQSSQTEGGGGPWRKRRS